MSKVSVLSRDPKETINLGKKIATQLKAGDIICLFGDLGSGKTTLVKGIAAGLKISPVKVNSPTFVLMNTYEGRLPLYHFDLYRIDEVKDIFFLGYEEFLYGEGVAVVEWADRLGKLLPKDCLTIELSAPQEDQRQIDLSSTGEHYQKLMKSVKP